MENKRTFDDLEKKKAQIQQLQEDLAKSMKKAMDLAQKEKQVNQL